MGDSASLRLIDIAFPTLAETFYDLLRFGPSCNNASVMSSEIGQRYLTDAKFQEAVTKALTPPPPPPPPKPSPEPILLLTLMQREGRLIR